MVDHLESQPVAFQRGGRVAYAGPPSLEYKGNTLAIGMLGTVTVNSPQSRNFRSFFTVNFDNGTESTFEADQAGLFKKLGGGPLTLGQDDHYCKKP